MLHTIDSVLNLPAKVDPGTLHSFHAKAEADLAAIRRGIIVFLQDHRSVGDLELPIRVLHSLRLIAQAAGLDDIGARITDCEQALTEIPNSVGSASEHHARRALDLVAGIEAALLQNSLRDDDLNFSITGFLDESFERLTNGRDSETLDDVAEDGFEIDEETMEIFRTEAAELLEIISANLKTLAAQPNDREALWNIRRSAHTFKGAAGVIGLKEASELAHRLEDLLDKLAENQQEITPAVIELLTTSTVHLNSITLGCSSIEPPKSLAAIYINFDQVISGSMIRTSTPDTLSPINLTEPTRTETHESDADPIKPPPAPIVRVALDKLDELLDLIRDLATNRSALSAGFGEYSNAAPVDQLNSGTFEKVRNLFEAQRNLTSQIHEKLLQIRMVRFGMLATRINRAVHVTCQEEDKKAEVIIENEDFEIDTQILDSLVEPLLHLLRNAVVHGIESPQRRRLIGKPEKGQIRIRVESDCDEIVVSVQDDGRGISVAKLREKAILSGVLDAATADSLTDEETVELIFLRGFTTADKLSINAGRGVGMSIVKDSIGSFGGSILVASESQKGTAFTIKIPMVLDTANLHTTKDEEGLFSHISIPQVIDHKMDLSILIVDDSSSVRQMIKRIVEDAGWKGVTATDGQNAVEILSNPDNRFDIILTDLEMPNLNGYELLELLKGDRDLRDIPVVMVTSRADQANRQKAIELGAADFLTKPFGGDALIEIIKKLTLQLHKPAR